MATNAFTTSVSTYSALADLAFKGAGDVIESGETNELKDLAKLFNSWVQGNAQMGAGIELPVPGLAVNGTGFRMNTLAALEALGTDDGIAVGTVAWDVTGKRVVHCLTTAAATSTWGGANETMFAFSFFSTSDGALDYVPFGQDTESSTITSGPTELQSPVDGVADGVLVHCRGDTGPLVCGLHLNGNTTAEDSDTLDPGAADIDLEFDISMPVSKNDRVAVSLDATDNPTLFRVTLIFRGRK